MNKLFWFLILFLGINAGTSAQKTDSLKYIYNNQTIYRYGGWFIKGSDRLTFRDLKAEFSISELGMHSFNKARKYKTISNVFRFISVLSSIAAAAYITSNNRNTAYAFMGGQFVLLLGSFHYYTLSNQSLDRALWQRNKDLLFPK